MNYENYPSKVYYCQAGGHYWHWQYSPEMGGTWFPAFDSQLSLSVEEVENAEEKYCGCND